MEDAKNEMLAVADSLTIILAASGPTVSVSRARLERMLKHTCRGIASLEKESDAERAEASPEEGS